MWSLFRLTVCLVVGSTVLGSPLHAQLVIEAQMTITGTVESVSPGVIVVKDQDGKAHSVRVQEKGKKSVALKGGQLLRFPCEVNISGNYKAEKLERGQNIKVIGQVNRLGRTQGRIKEIWLVDSDDAPNGIKVVKASGTPGGFSTCEVVCQFTRLVRGKLIVAIPATIEFSRKKSLSFELADEARVKFKSDDLRRAVPGAKVTRLVAVRLNTGDILAKGVDVEIIDNAKDTASVDDKLLAKYRKLSDQPKAPRLIRSAHYAFMSDVSDRQAQIILDKLETMTGLLTNYFGRGPRGIVEGFIVRDLTVWPQGLLQEPRGIAKVREGAGVCFNTSLGNKRRAVLYSCDDHGVVQHECTHGFCHLTFGSAGPTWLAEGVAEMGQYFKADQRAVDISPIVISYLRNSKPKKMLEIAIPGRTDSGTWRDYAWRWALCQLLANNPNYASRFKPLAISLMEETPGVSFAAVYGPVAQQVSFEYDLFLKSLDNGYRTDLCAWQWNAKFKPLPKGKRPTKVKVLAAYGWQPSGWEVSKGESYDVAARGTWSIAKDGSVHDADGDQAGRGRLVGVVFANYKLSKTIPMGQRATFVAPVDGQLYLRCLDDWNKLADNGGELEVYFRKSLQE